MTMPLVPRKKARTAGNVHLAETIAESFCKEDGTSDCEVVFYREADPAAAKRQRVEAEGAGSDGLGPAEGEPESRAEPEVFSSPLPAHTFVLRFASKRFAAQIERWGAVASTVPGCAAQPEPVAAGGSSSGTGHKRPHPEPGSAPDGRPVLRVPVADEAEAEAGRLAIRFAYTGEVQPCSIRQALETLRVADYLEIKGCGAACVEFTFEQLARQSPRQRAGGDTEPAVLQFYGCSALWPDAAMEPRFQYCMTLAECSLAQRFQDALAALNTPSLRQELLKLPAAGIEALLERDDFGTDSEDSILTLLATWMEANWAFTDAAARTRLARLLRLAQLSRPAAACLLSPLSVDYELKGEDHPAGWLPVSTGHAALLSSYTSNLPGQRRDIRRALPCAAWYEPRPRVRCLPSSGLNYEWTITRQQLQAALAAAAESGAEAAVNATFHGGAQDAIFARGFAWRVTLMHTPGHRTAALYLCPALPDAYRVPGSRLAAGGTFDGLPFPVRIGARITVHRWRNGRRFDAPVVDFGDRDALSLVTGLGSFEAFRLAPLAGGLAGQAAVATDPLAAWAKYLHEGRISGSLAVVQDPNRFGGWADEEEDEEEEEGEEGSEGDLSDEEEAGGERGESEEEEQEESEGLSSSDGEEESEDEDEGEGADAVRRQEAWHGVRNGLHGVNALLGAVLRRLREDNRALRRE